MEKQNKETVKLARKYWGYVQPDLLTYAVGGNTDETGPVHEYGLEIRLTSQGFPEWVFATGGPGYSLIFYPDGKTDFRFTSGFNTVRIGVWGEAVKWARDYVEEIMSY